MNKLFIFSLIFLFLSTFFLAGCQKPGNYLKLKESGEKKEEIVIREPAVAGGFYPADKNTLSAQIDEFLGKAQTVPAKGNLRILIVPHAGYPYSGPIAAWGFKQIGKKDYKRVIILGASHSSYFDKAAVWDKGSWRTPLGDVVVDEEFASKLISKSEAIQANLNAHLQEHSLEVEVPFLQKVLKNFRIVPILLGHSDSRLLESLAKSLAQNFDNRTLLVVSSDLSHYPPYEVANKVDKETIEAILSGDVEKFDQAIKKNLDKEGTDTCACGADAIKVAMLLAKELKFEEIKLFKYANSGDTGGDKSRVVGYAAIGFWGEISNVKSPTSAKATAGKQNLINENGQKKLLEIARETLESYLKDGKMPEFKIDDDQLNQKFGVFVTLRKDGQLRGCIGEFEPDQPLYKLVQKKVVDSATTDPRFYSVQYDELESIKIEISVLSPRQKIDDWRKIELGKHGVVIKKGMRGGTFLPQVAEETGWGLEEFLSHLCSDKAGLSDDCYKDPKTEIFIYTAQVFEEE